MDQTEGPSTAWSDNPAERHGRVPIGRTHRPIFYVGQKLAPLAPSGWALGLGAPLLVYLSEELLDAPSSVHTFVIRKA
jgi:hypothetical protein